MIVAGAEMHIGFKPFAFAAHYQINLGVGLFIHEAVDHLCAGAFQIARPANVSLFIKARFQLDHGGNRFAGFGGFDQGFDDG